MHTAPAMTAAAHGTAAPRTRLPNKWTVAAAASATHALHATAVYMIPCTLLSPMRQTLGLSVPEVTRPLNVYRLVQAALLFPTGMLLDRVGPQLPCRIGVTAAALLAPLLACANSLTHLIVLQTLYSLTKLLAGLACLLLVIAQAFPDGKGVGTASSILIAGYSFAGFLAPAIIGSVSQRYGWRAAVLVFNLPFGLVAIPLTFTVLVERGAARPSAAHYVAMVRRRVESAWRRATPVPADDPDDPDDLAAAAGGKPSGKAKLLSAAAVAATTKSTSAALPANPMTSTSSIALFVDVPTAASAPTGATTTTGATYAAKGGEGCGGGAAAHDGAHDPIFTAGYALIFCAVGAFAFSMHIIFDHFLVFLNEDIDMPFATATRYISLLNLASVFAKLSIGPVSDRVNKSLLLVVFGVLGALASCILFTPSPVTNGFVLTTNLSRIAWFIALYSVSYSSIFSVTTSVLPEFGARKLGVRSNLNMMALNLGGSAGSYLAAQWRSRYGSYAVPFMLNGMCFSVVAVAGACKFVLDRRTAAWRAKAGDEGSELDDEADEISVAVG